MLIGPAGSGKGTVAKLVADKCNLLYVDSGATYRCVALETINRRIKLEDKEAIIKVNMGLMYWKDVDNRNCIVNKDNATGYSILGAYATKERTIEVLNEIQNLIKDFSSNSLFCFFKKDTILFFALDVLTYQIEFHFFAKE